MKADFSYSINNKTILIIDKGTSKSVTNDIQNVLGSIAFKEGIDPESYNIAYRDSMGEWDGVLLENDRVTFYPIRKPNEQAVLDFFKARDKAIEFVKNNLKSVEKPDYQLVILGETLNNSGIYNYNLYEYSTGMLPGGYGNLDKIKSLIEQLINVDVKVIGQPNNNSKNQEADKKIKFQFLDSNFIKKDKGLSM